MLTNLCWSGTYITGSIFSKASHIGLRLGLGQTKVTSGRVFVAVRNCATSAEDCHFNRSHTLKILAEKRVFHAKLGKPTIGGSGVTEAYEQRPAQARPAEFADRARGAAYRRATDCTGRRQ